MNTNKENLLVEHNMVNGRIQLDVIPLNPSCDMNTNNQDKILEHLFVGGRIYYPKTSVVDIQGLELLDMMNDLKGQMDIRYIRVDESGYWTKKD